MDCLRQPAARYSGEPRGVACQHPERIKTVDLGRKARLVNAGNTTDCTT